MKDKCAGCGATFAPGEMRCYSQLYAPGGDKILLCQACSDTEEECVEMCGTNDCPELLASYGHHTYKEACRCQEDTTECAIHSQG